MELCTPRTFSTLYHHRLFFTSNRALLPWKTSLPFKQSSVHRTNRGLLYHTNSSLRSTTSDETSTDSTKYVGEEVGVINAADDQPVQTNFYADDSQKELPEERSSTNGQVQAFEFLDKLDIKNLQLPQLDSDDTYSVLLLGGGALVALWIATAVVGAVNSIPVLPNFLELVGLTYTLWFSSRYLIFKKNREELGAKIEEIKQQVLGSSDD